MTTNPMFPDVVSKADENPSHADNSSANGNNTIYPDISTLKAQVRNDKEFWAEIGKQYGPYHYEYSTVRFDFINDFDDFKLCTDEAISNEIIDRVKGSGCLIISWISALDIMQ